MHVTHILEDDNPQVGLCGAPQEPKPAVASTAQCSACYILMVQRENQNGE